MMMLRTDRLTGQPLQAGHVAALRRLHGDSKVMATLSPDARTLSENDTRTFLQRSLAHWKDHGFGIWMFWTGSNDLAGYAGLRHDEVEGADEVELFYAVRSALWGRGLATEMAQAVLAAAAGPFDITDVVAFTRPANAASRRVMEKCSFRYERDIVYAGLPHVLYRWRP